MVNPHMVIDKAPSQLLLSSINHYIFTFHNIILSSKFNQNKILIWKYQIMKILRSLELDNYVLNDSLNQILSNGTIKSKLQAIEEARQNSQLLVNIL